MAAKSKAEARSLYYAFILYPESAPSNWTEILESYHVQMLISPEHHPGGAPEPGEPEGVEKKVHRHVMILYGSTKSSKQAAEIAESVNGTLPFPVHSKEGYARYLCHLDNRDKEQFPDLAGVVELSGAVYRDNIGSPYNRATVIREMIEYIKINGLFSFSEFLDWCSENNDTWYRSLINDSTYVIKEYQKTMYWTMKNRLELQQMQQIAKDEYIERKAANENPFADPKNGF